MFGWGNTSVLPIAIDIGTHSIKVLQLRHKAGRLSLQAASRAEIPALTQAEPAIRTACILETLQKLLANGSFVGKHCITSLSPSQLHTKSLRLPQMPEADLGQAVQWEAKDRLGFDLAEGRLAYFRAGEVRRGTETRDEILLFAATAEVLRSHVQLISDAGLHLHAIDIQPCAMLRAAQRVLPINAGAVRAVVDIGSSGTQLVIAQDDRMLFYKHIDIGANTFDAAVAQKLGISPTEAAQIRARLSLANPPDDDDSSAHFDQAVADALRPPLEELARELDMCIRYYVVTFRGTRPETIALVGGQSHSERIIEPIASTLGIPLEAAQPLRGIANLSEITRPDRSGDWAIAAGLALYTLESAKLEAAA